MSVAVGATLGAVAAIVQLAESQKVVPGALAWVAPLGAALFPWIGPTVFWVVLLSCVGILLYDALASRLERVDGLRRELSAARDSAKPQAQDREQKDAPESAAAITLRLPADRPVDRESFIQLRAYFSFCRPALTIALNFLDAGICAKARGDNAAAVADLMRRLVVNKAGYSPRNLTTNIEQRLTPPTQKDFTAILSQLSTMMHTSYFEILACIRQAADVIIEKDSVVFQPGYALLFKYHTRLVNEARRYGSRPDWGSIVPRAAALESLLDPPRYSIDSIPYGMSATEIHKHVESGFDDEFIGREWAAEITLDRISQRPQGGELLLDGHLASGSVVSALIKRISSIDAAQLREGRKATVMGAIKSVESTGIVLDPAGVERWETPVEEKADAPSLQS